MKSLADLLTQLNMQRRGIAAGPSAQNFPGLVVPGNIINLYNRPQTSPIASPLGTVQNQMTVQDGGQRGPTQSTTYSKGFTIGNNEVVLPTVVNGKFLSDQEAIDRYLQTGQHLGMFKKGDYANSDAFAGALHNSQAAMGNFYGPTSK